MTLADRLFAKTRTVEGCWVYFGALAKKRQKGKGQIRMSGRPYRIVSAAAAAWFVRTGHLPTKGFVPTCSKRRLCINPDHLQLEPQSFFAKSMDYETVRIIRALYATGEYWQTELARKFGLSQRAVNQLILGHSYRMPHGEREWGAK